MGGESGVNDSVRKVQQRRHRASARGGRAARALLSLSLGSRGQPRARGWASGAKGGRVGGCAPTRATSGRAARAFHLAEGGHGGVVLRARLGARLEGLLGRDDALAVELAHRLLLHAARAAPLLLLVLLEQRRLGLHGARPWGEAVGAWGAGGGGR